MRRQLKERSRAAARVLEFPTRRPVLKNESADEKWFKKFNPILSELMNELQRYRDGK